MKDPIAAEAEALDEATAADPGRTSALAALLYRDFRLFWIGLLVSNIGTWMQQFGLGWLVVQLAIRDATPQLAPLYLGLVGLARAIPGLAFGLFGGVVAHRADRRRLLIVTQSSAAILASVLGVLTIPGSIKIVEVVLISALNSIIFSFDAPARQAMVPRLVSDRHLMRPVGSNSAAVHGATLVGPLVGAVDIRPLGVRALPPASLGSWKRDVGVPVAAAFAHGTLFMLFGTQGTLLGATVFVGLTSLAVMVFMGMGSTLMQTRTPDALRGRVMSVQTMVFIGFMPLGQMLLGSVGTVAGINTAFLFGGILVTLLAGYAAIRVSALREAVATVRPRAVAS